jgi:hypothetical protein
MQMQQQNMAKAAGPATVGGGRAAEWLSNGQGRTVAPSPVPTRRVVGTRVGSANGQREGVEMSGLMRISSNVRCAGFYRNSHPRKGWECH